jgi:transposase-like protein
LSVLRAQTKQWKAGKGSSSGSQRYRCGHGQRPYTPEPKESGYPQAVRCEAVKMYLDGGNYRRVARALGVGPTSVMNWVRDQAQQTPVAAPVPSSAAIIEIDELLTAQAPKRDKRTDCPS